MSLAPEVLAEQIMGYVVWAVELIPTLTPSPEKQYALAILPQGPHFYTWLLQSAGYLLLDSSKKKSIILSHQSDDPQNIIVDQNTYGPIFGKNQKHSNKKIEELICQLNGKWSDPKIKALQEKMDEQLSFLRVITEIDEVYHISIGDDISLKQIKKVSDRIQKNISECNIIFLSNIELAKSAESARWDEQVVIAKSIQTPSASKPLFTLFQQILASQKRKSEVIAYVNPWDFGRKKSLTTRYVCVVG